MDSPAQGHKTAEQQTKHVQWLCTQLVVLMKDINAHLNPLSPDNDLYVTHTHINLPANIKLRTCQLTIMMALGAGCNLIGVCKKIVTQWRTLH